MRAPFSALGPLIWDNFSILEQIAPSRGVQEREYVHAVRIFADVARE